MERSSRTVVVVGAGAAGIAASIAAARRGADVALLERADHIGGIVSRGLIHTIGGLYDARGEFINEGLPAELASRLVRASPRTGKRRIGRLWTLAADPNVYRDVTENWLREERRVRLFTRVRATRFEVCNQEVSSVIFESGRQKHSFGEPLAVIDCTGNGNAVRAIDAGLTSGHVADAMGAVVLRVTGVDAGAFDQFARLAVRRVLERVAAQGQLPDVCRHTWVDRGIEPDEVYLKVPVLLNRSRPWPNIGSAAPDDIQRSVTGVCSRIADVLSALPSFKNARLTQVGEVSARGAARCCGVYELSAADVRALRKFDDPACRCAWPIEHWSPDGGVRIEYLDNEGWYDVPLRSLKVRGLENVWCAGKCLSADLAAQASARIAGCCWAMGEAAARAAMRKPSPNSTHAVA